MLIEELILYYNWYNQFILTCSTPVGREIMG